MIDEGISPGKTQLVSCNEDRLTPARYARTGHYRHIVCTIQDLLKVVRNEGTAFYSALGRALRPCPSLCLRTSRPVYQDHNTG